MSNLGSGSGDLVRAIGAIRRIGLVLVVRAAINIQNIFCNNILILKVCTCRVVPSLTPSLCPFLATMYLRVMLAHGLLFTA